MTKWLILIFCTIASLSCSRSWATDGSEFFESKIRPLLVKHCYECHSEEAKSREGGLLLDRPSGWIDGGDSGRAVVPNQPDTSLVMAAVTFRNENLQMPPDGKLSEPEIALIREWIQRGAPGPKEHLGETEFSRLGDQDALLAKAKDHWAFQPVRVAKPPTIQHQRWNQNPVDQFVFSKLDAQGLGPSAPTTAENLLARLSFVLTGLAPTYEDKVQFARDHAASPNRSVMRAIDRLLSSPAYAEHMGRLWLDVARYADTDSSYRPDTKTPHYFPFAFTYRDYVVASFASDKPFDQFVKEQFAADLMGFEPGDSEIAALGFLAVGPHAQRNAAEALDDWIDVTTRGLMGLTVACARCHDHKYEPIPTADYYSLRGVFAGLNRIQAFDLQKLPPVHGYLVTRAENDQYQRQLDAIQGKINAAGDAKAKNNNRSIAEKIRDTDLAKLLAFSPGAPAHAMIVRDKPRIPASYIFVRGDATSRGEEVPRRFLRVLDPQQASFESLRSGRLELADKIIAPENPLTARVYVNRIWKHLIGSGLVRTTSDFGLQGSPPSHPDLLDWLTDDFVRHEWSTKHLVRRIASSATFAQRSAYRADAYRVDPANDFLWRSQRRHLSIEMIRDRILRSAGQLDRRVFGRPEELWGERATHRRAIYGFVNRFNLDATLRAFDFPTPMQSQGQRDESIVAPQTLFLMNSPFVVQQASALIERPEFSDLQSDHSKISFLYESILQRQPAANETPRITRFLELQRRFKPTPRFPLDPWSQVAQSLMMTNEFQYVD